MDEVISQFHEKTNRYTLNLLQNTFWSFAKLDGQIEVALQFYSFRMKANYRFSAVNKLLCYLI